MVQISLQNSGGKGGWGVHRTPWAPTGVKVTWSLSVKSKSIETCISDETLKRLKIQIK